MTHYLDKLGTNNLTKSTLRYVQKAFILVILIKLEIEVTAT